MALNHKHILVNGTCRKPLTSELETENWFYRLVYAVGMKIAIDPKAKYVSKEGNEGITGTCCIETSHTSIHFWDKAKPQYFRFDLYSCDDFDPKVVMNLIKEFDPIETHYVLLDRNHDITPVTQQWDKYD